MATFIHTADWQIGRQYTRFAPEDAAVLAEARFDAVRRIAQLAAEQRVDAVLVAGDVFDAQTVSDRTIGRLFNALQAYTGPWLMIPGNHDAALAESVWQRAARIQAIPANVHLMLKPGVAEFPESGFALLAAPLTQRHTYDDLTGFFDEAETTQGLLRIGLAHGCVQGILADGIDSANPIAADRAARARLDYLALGDWHGTRRIEPRVWYAGTPEPERFRNNDAGQVLHVAIEAPGSEPSVTARAIGRHQWQQWEEQLAIATDADRIVERLKQVRETDVISVRLRGQTDLAGRRRIEAAARAAEARARALQLDLDHLRMMPSDEDLADLQADGYVGEVLQELRDRQQREESEIAADALALLAGLLANRRAQGDAA